jgi:hypothetical protein
MLLQDNLSNPTSWKKLYTAALVETDNRRTPILIEQAQNAIIVRARQLFESGEESFAEEQALDSALLTLKLLGTCLRKAPQPAIQERTYSAAVSA